MRMGQKKKPKSGRPPLTPETETAEHKDAFEMYVALGSGMSKRSRVLKISEEFDKSYATIFKWKKILKWDERLKERESRIRRKIERNTDNKIVDVAEKYLRLVELSIDDYLVRAEQGDIIRLEKTIDIDRLLKLGLHIQQILTSSEPEQKSPEEIKEETRQRAEEYEEYFKELESEVEYELIAEEAESTGDENSSDGDSG